MRRVSVVVPLVCDSEILFIAPAHNKQNKNMIISILKQLTATLIPFCKKKKNRNFTQPKPQTIRK